MLKQLNLFEDEPDPADDEATAATAEFQAQIEMSLHKDMNRIVFKILVWGPGTRSKSSVANKRRQILEHLRAANHQCWFSEEFQRPPGMSLKAFELAQAKLVDLIVLLVEPHAPGPLGEMHDFCSHKELLSKIRLFFPEVMTRSYNGMGLVYDLDKGYRVVEMYKERDIEECRVLTKVMEWVQARRSYEYSHSSLA